MNIQFNKTSDVAAELTISMEKADYQAAAEAYLLSAGLGEDEIAQLIMCLSEG